MTEFSSVGVSETVLVPVKLTRQWVRLSHQASPLPGILNRSRCISFLHGRGKRSVLTSGNCWSMLE
jgi:hypothetical protein